MKLADDLFAYPWSQTTANNCNTYVLGGEFTLMIDPGHRVLYDHVAMGLAADKVKEVPDLVVITHCHPDHMEAAAELQKKGSLLAMHPAEVQYMESEGRQLAAALGLDFPQITVDMFLQEGELNAGDHRLQVIHTPGHSPGHICLVLPRWRALVSGDLVFVQGVGRVDFPGGDGEALKASIRKVARLDVELLLPGHGPLLQGADNLRRNFEFIEQMYFSML